MTKEELRALNFRIKSLKETVEALHKNSATKHFRTISEWEARIDELESFKSWAQKKSKKK